VSKSYFFYKFNEKVKNCKYHYIIFLVSTEADG